MYSRNQTVFNSSGTTSDGLKLIEGKFVVDHGVVLCELVAEVFPPMHTPSPQSTTQVMKQVIRSCDVGHTTT